MKNNIHTNIMVSNEIDQFKSWDINIVIIYYHTASEAKITIARHNRKQDVANKHLMCNI